MAIDGEVQQLLEAQKSLGFGRYQDQGVAGARDQFIAVSRFRRGDGPMPPVHKTWDETAATTAGPVPVRFYIPSASPSQVCIAYFHGGGWVMGGLATHDSQARLMAIATNAIVCSVDYRLAPEHPFPAGFEDCSATVRWLQSGAPDVDIDSQRIAVAGDSAGANLGAAVSLHHRGDRPVYAQLINYGVFDLSPGDDSEDDESTAAGTTIDKASTDWFTSQYLTSPTDALDHRASPLRNPDQSGLPPTIVTTAGEDPARDAGYEYSGRLEEAGNEVLHLDFPGLIHGFFMYSNLVSAAEAAVDETYREFARILHRT